MKLCCWTQTPLSSTASALVGKGGAAKSDEFSEKNPNGLRPPPLILENYVAIFFIMDMVAFMKWGIGQIVSINNS